MKKRWVTAGSERVHYLKVGEYTVATVDRRDGWWCVHVFGRQTEGSPATLKDVKKDYDVIGEMLKGGISPKEPVGALTTSPIVAQRKYETIELMTSDQFVHLMNVAHGSGPSDLEDPMYDAMAKALRA